MEGRWTYRNRKQKKLGFIFNRGVQSGSKTTAPNPSLGGEVLIQTRLKNINNLRRYRTFLSHNIYDFAPYDIPDSINTLYLL